MKWILSALIMLIVTLLITAAKVDIKPVTKFTALRLCQNAAASFLGTEALPIHSQYTYNAFSLDEALDPTISGLVNSDNARLATKNAYKDGRTAGNLYTSFAFPKSSGASKIRCYFTYTIVGLVKFDLITVDERVIPEISFKLGTNSDAQVELYVFSESDITYIDRLLYVVSLFFWKNLIF